VANGGEYVVTGDLINDRMPWLFGPGECLDCGKQWIEVWPIGADKAYCPACGSDDTVRDEICDR